MIITDRFISCVGIAITYIRNYSGLLFLCSTFDLMFFTWPCCSKSLFTKFTPIRCHRERDSLHWVQTIRQLCCLLMRWLWFRCLADTIECLMLSFAFLSMSSTTLVTCITLCLPFFVSCHNCVSEPCIQSGLKASRILLLYCQKAKVYDSKY